MNYAENGELLKLLNKVGSLDEECTRFYSAEIVLALEHLHRLNIIHRDLKPENVLLNAENHIQITDFGSACRLKTNQEQQESLNELEIEGPVRRRQNSFVGTAQYVSPEMLNNHKKVGRPTDLWALGCIIYQLTSGSLAFKERTDYLIFQKILKLDYKFPDGFNSVIRDLIEQFLKIEPDERLGAHDELKDKVTNEDLPYKSIRAHPFFKPLENRWNSLHLEEAPKILPYVPSNSNSEELRSEFKCNKEIKIEPGLDSAQMERLLRSELCDESNNQSSSHFVRRSIMDFSEDEFKTRLEKQEKESKWHRFVDGNLILKEGFINKRKGLFARKRMFLLTTGPHIYYVDPVNMVLKGEIPWCSQLNPELKNFKNFFVHTVSLNNHLNKFQI